MILPMFLKVRPNDPPATKLPKHELTIAIWKGKCTCTYPIGSFVCYHKLHASTSIAIIRYIFYNIVSDGPLFKMCCYHSEWMRTKLSNNTIIQQCQSTNTIKKHTSWFTIEPWLGELPCSLQNIKTNRAYCTKKHKPFRNF